MKSVFAQIVDLIFPPRCVVCGQLGELVCGRCRRKLRVIPTQCCPVCRRPRTGGVCCLACASNSNLTALLSAGELNDPVLKQLIASLKYDRLSSIAPIIATRMIRLARKEKAGLGYITFVPITTKRRAGRGFNQAELLARETARALKIPFGAALRKQKETKTQVGLGRAERARNLRGAFVCSDTEGITGLNVLLVDDVYTTGATTEECARILLKAGANSVTVLCATRE